MSPEKDVRFWNMLLHEEWLDAAAFLKSNETSLAEKALAVNYLNTDGCSTLLLAALHGAHLSLIQQILNVGNVDILLKGTAGSGWTPLIIACDRYDHSQTGKDHLDFIQLLIDVGGKDLVCRVDDSQRTALHWACDKLTPYPEVIGLLIKAGGKELLTKTDKDHNTALHQLCLQQPSHEVIKLLIRAGGKDVCRARNSRGEIALHLYCRVKLPQIDVVEDMVVVGGKEILNWVNSKEVRLVRQSQLSDDLSDMSWFTGFIHNSHYTCSSLQAIHNFSIYIYIVTFKSKLTCSSTFAFFDSEKHLMRFWTTDTLRTIRKNCGNDY